MQGVVEVETGESVNHLEALAQWAHFARLKVPFHLYVPAATIDVARRLSSDHQIPVAELWIYDNIGDQVRFTLVHRSTQASPRAASPQRPVSAARVETRPAARRPATPRKAKAAARPVKAAVKRPAAGRARKAPVRKPAAQKAGPHKRR